MSVATPPNTVQLQRLDRHAEVVAPSGAPVLGRDDLRELMRAVTETTRRLESTHEALQGEVTRLQRELAEANAALRRSQALAALGEMAAGIAHEVRNPLASIQLYVQMLADDLAGSPCQAELCGKIDRAVSGLDAVVRDVLNFARDMVIRPEPTTTRQVLERAVDGCAVLLSADIDVERVSGMPIPFQADISLVTQALGNLIRNAVEAMVESGREPKVLRLSGSRRRMRCPNGRQELRIVLGVQDSGPGIDPAVLGRIFNPFFTTRATGTGLGLAIVHRIIDAHGGHINIETLDKHAGKPAGGTLIELCLPARPVVTKEPSQNVSPRNREHGS